MLTMQLQDYVKQNNSNIDKYFNTIEELQQLKTEQINLESANYDMVYILDLQKQLLEKYLGSDK